MIQTGTIPQPSQKGNQIEEDTQMMKYAHQKPWAPVSTKSQIIKVAPQPHPHYSAGIKKCPYVHQQEIFLYPAYNDTFLQKQIYSKQMHVKHITKNGQILGKITMKEEKDPFQCQFQMVSDYEGLFVRNYQNKMVFTSWDFKYDGISNFQYPKNQQVLQMGYFIFPQTKIICILENDYLGAKKQNAVSKVDYFKYPIKYGDKPIQSLYIPHQASANESRGIYQIDGSSEIAFMQISVGKDFKQLIINIVICNLEGTQMYVKNFQFGKDRFIQYSAWQRFNSMKPKLNKSNQGMFCLDILDAINQNKKLLIIWDLNSVVQHTFLLTNQNSDWSFSSVLTTSYKPFLEYQQQRVYREQIRILHPITYQNIGYIKPPQQQVWKYKMLTVPYDPNILIQQYQLYSDNKYQSAVFKLVINKLNTLQHLVAHYGIFFLFQALPECDEDLAREVFLLLGSNAI